MYLVFDVGGTHTRIGVSLDKKTLHGEVRIIDTPRRWIDAERMFRDVLSPYTRVKGVCGCLPGVLDEECAVLRWSPNLSDWVDKPVGKLLAEITGVRPELYNDAVLAGVGGSHFGSGRKAEIVAYLTVSTGLGGARIVKGLPDKRHSGFEPGQQIIDFHHGLTLEQLVSGSAFARKYGKDFIKTTPREVWKEGARVLAVGIHNTMMYWSPDVVVLGGSMMTKLPGIPLSEVKNELSVLPRVFPELPMLVLAELGDTSALMGALVMLSHHDNS